MPSANVTDVEDVGDIKSGNSPIRFETRIRMAKVATTGKYFNPCGPMMSSMRPRTASTATSSVCWPPCGSSSESRLPNSLPFKIQTKMIVNKQAMTNITVYQGTAASGEYLPKTPSAFVPKKPKNLSHIGFV